MQIQQGQSGTSVAYSTPVEYRLTPQMGDCDVREARHSPRRARRLELTPLLSLSLLVCAFVLQYDRASERAQLNTTQAFLQAVLSKYTFGPEPFVFSPAVNTSINVTSSSFLSWITSNSKEAEEARLRFGKGLISTFTESIKRTYYRATLRPTR